MHGKCPDAIWYRDDFTACFERDYLQTYLPLFVCGLSIVVLAIQLGRHTGQSKRPTDDSAIANGRTVFDVPRDAQNGNIEEDEATGRDDEDASEPLLSVRRIKSHTNESVVKIDRPKGESLVNLVEELAVLCEVAIHLVGLLTLPKHSDRAYASVAGLGFWTYILALTSMRLLMRSAVHHSLTTLWSHTAALYGLQWLSSALIFRSAIIHPSSRLTQGLVFADFALVTLLGVLVVSVRKSNEAVLVEREDDLEPSKEPLASLFSLVTFSWVDAIVWQGYRKTFEMADVWNLAPSDKAGTILHNFRQAKRTSALAFHLLKYFKKLFLLQAVYACFSGFLTFAPTLLLKAILQYIEDPEATPANAAWFYVLLLPVTGIAQTLTDGQALWTGRKICVRLRAVIIGEIYGKALRRKAAAGGDTILGDAAQAMREPSLWDRMMSIGQKKEEPKKNEDGSTKEGKDPDSQVNMGTIINLMAVDSFKVSEVTAYLHFLWAASPVQFVVAIVLLYRILGYSSIAGIGTMLLLLPINVVIAQGFSRLQKKIMAATDARIHTTNEVLQNIRIIKFFAWEQRFDNIVNEKRSVELKALRNRYILWSVAATIWYGAPLLITFLSFFVYTVVEKKALVPSVAFTALSLFSILRIPLDQFADMLAHVQDARVSVDRVDEFLREEETEKYEQLRPIDGGEDAEPRIALEHVTCTWGGRASNDIDATSAFRLMEINVDFQVGELNLIAGPTGSGKTSLLMALLGEMTLLGGRVHLPGGHSREEVRPHPETGLSETIAYCAQQAWLVNDTIKQNILFASPLDRRRYNDVIKACALTRDLEILDAGDQTLVGEKGIALSGGQKQRISLARALYSNARHVLLDDCLSAVDSHTAKWIFDHCVLGPLMFGRTCVLVTHNVSLCLPQSRYIVVLDNGRVTAQGSPEHILSVGVLGDEVLPSRPGSKGDSRIPSRVPSTLDHSGLEREESTAAGSNGHANGNGKLNGDAHRKASNAQEDRDEANANARTESKAEGGVKTRIMRLYLSSMGRWYYWMGAGLFFVLQQMGSVATSLWIREWSNAYQTENVGVSVAAQQSGMSPDYSLHRNHLLSYVSVHCLRSAHCGLTLPTSPSTYSTNAKPKPSIRSNDGVDVSYYLTVYALLAAAYMLVSLAQEFIMFWGSLAASWTLHERLLESVTRAKFRFFDSTPLGQLMNRFSKDVEAIDQEVAAVALSVMNCLFSVATIIVLVSVITPKFLIVATFISALYFVIGKFYIRSSRDLKRLESVQRSPLYQQFGETLSGIITIRAYGDERRFIRDNLQRVNTHSRPFIYMWATNRWLSIRVDVGGALVAFFAGAFVVLNAGNIDAGAAGLSLTYAVSFTENVLWLVRLYAVNEQNMNSVERVSDYLDVEQEAQAIIPEARPPHDWPSKGRVQFIDYSTRYREDLDPVLKNVSFKIEALEKVGIVGRTGAGKSSLALALFRGLEAEEGKILIDEVDVGLIGLQDLRERITIVPQDPTLFTGTIKSNLDPFGLFTDEEIFTALRRVHLLGSSPTQSASKQASAIPTSSVETAPTTKENKNIFESLDSPVTESGNNLSQGQKQLLCLARAILKQPRVILMDEATASIDYNTDARIQTTIRELECTTITIAHRLQTIIDYDKVLVLDHGEVKEFAHPWELLQKEDGIFRGMCETSGELEQLLEGAKKAWVAGGHQLIEVD